MVEATQPCPARGDTPISELPRLPGTYVLVMRLPRLTTIRVGRLGCFPFPAGWYAYVGSARGPGGLGARVSRHLRLSKPLHWHVDYVRVHAEPVEIWYTLGAQGRECAWAQALSSLPEAAVVAPGFGASDCHCTTHLFHFAETPDLDTFVQAAGGPVSQERLTPNSPETE
jgi:Uri superfamily endonuclease